MAFLGDLVIRMKADTADFRSDLQKAQQSAQSMSKGVMSALTTATAAFGGLSVAVAAYQMKEALLNTLETAENFNKLSIKTGIAAEALSAYAVSAKLADVPQEMLDMGLKKLAVNMTAAAGGAKEQAAVFSALGVKTTEANGALRKTDDVLEDVAKAFEEMKDGPGKAAIAVALFGKSGDAMIPMLNNLRESKDEARKLGVVFGADFARSAEEFNDNMKRVQIAGEGVRIMIATAMLPRLIEISKEFVTAAENGNRLLGALNALSQAAGWTDPERVKNEKAIIELAERHLLIENQIAEYKSRNVINSAAAIATMREELAKIDAEVKKRSALANPDRPEWRDARDLQARGPVIQRDAPIIPKGDDSAAKAEAARQKKMLDIWIKGYNARQQETEDYYVWEAARDAQRTQERIDAMEEQRRGMEESLRISRENEAELMEASSFAVLQAEVKRQKEAAKEVTEFWRSAAQGMQSAMSNFFFDVMDGNLRDLGDGFKRALMKMVADVAAAKAATQLFGADFGKGGDIGGIVGKVLGSMSGTTGGYGGQAAGSATSESAIALMGWADGGPIWRGQSGWVGENGPEWINAGVSGTVTPNGGGGTTVYIDATGADAAGLARVEAQLRRMDASIERRSVAAVMDSRVRGSAQ